MKTVKELFTRLWLVLLMTEEGTSDFDELICHPDKPVLVPTIKVDKNTDLLEGKKFFVLRGYMKSGTNWACRILNLHPEISCAGEFHWKRLVKSFNENLAHRQLAQKKPGFWPEMKNCLERMIKECIVLANHPAAIWVGDRTPENISPGMVREARIFNLIRDGRDVLVSKAYHFFNNPKLFRYFRKKEENRRLLREFQKDSRFFMKHPERLLSCTEFVIETIESWKMAIRHNFEKTRDLESEMVMELRYEALHADVEKTRATMYRFLDVDPSLAGPLNSSTNPGFEDEKPDNFLRKGAVGDWKNYFSPEVEKLFMDIAGDTLEQLGYV